MKSNKYFWFELNFKMSYQIKVLLIKNLVKTESEMALWAMSLLQQEKAASKEMYISIYSSCIGGTSLVQQIQRFTF